MININYAVKITGEVQGSASSLTGSLRTSSTPLVGNVQSDTVARDIWGYITGDISDQSDLMSLLNQKADLSDIPENVSAFNNDAGYVTSEDVPTKISDLTNDSDFVESTDLSAVAFSGDYDDLTDTPTIPTNTSDLTNDSGYITGISSGDVTTALGYTPYDSSNPNGYTSNTGTITGITMNGASKGTSGVVDLGTVVTDVSGKQDTLVSGTNIKTINNESLLGSGNITIQGGGGGSYTAGTGIDITSDVISNTGVVSFNGNTGAVTYNAIPYLTCATAKGTAAKTTTLVSGTFTASDLVAGAHVLVKFTNSNTASDPTLSVNGTTAKTIKKYGTTAPGTSAKTSWNAGTVFLFLYDGTYWMMADWLNNDTTYSGMTTTEISDGTGTTARLITPANLKTAIQTWDHVKSVNTQTGTVVLDADDIAYDNTTSQMSAMDVQGAVDELVSEKQDTLVSGTNIKTVNNESLLGSGNLTIQSGSSYSAGTGISIASDTITNTAPIWHGDDTGTFTTPINADQLEGYTVNTLLKLIYPVGSIYMSTVNTSPSTFITGTTWTQLENRFLLGAGSSYTAGATGGEATHTLTVDEIPSHSHTTPIYYNSNSGTVTANRASYANQSSSKIPTESTGGGQAHNNMPPYLVVYMWERTT